MPTRHNRSSRGWLCQPNVAPPRRFEVAPPAGTANEIVVLFS